MQVLQILDRVYVPTAPKMSVTLTAILAYHNELSSMLHVTALDVET